MNKAQQLNRQIEAAMEAASKLRALSYATDDKSKIQDCTVWWLKIDAWTRGWRQELDQLEGE